MGTTVFLLVAILTVLLFFRENIINLFKKEKREGEGAENFDFFNSFFVEKYEYIRDLIGEDVTIILGSFMVILVITWIIGVIFTAITRKDSSEKIFKLGTSGGWILTLVGFFILMLVIHSLFFNEKETLKEEIKVELYRLKTGGITEVVAATTATFRVYIDPTSPRKPEEKGKAFWACPLVVWPEDVPEIYFKLISGNGTPVNTIQITEESRETLIKKGIIKVNIKFGKILAGRMPEDNPCKFLKL